MDVITVSCANCGAPIQLPQGIDQLNCAYCGAGLLVRRGEGYVSLQLAEKVVQAIQDTGAQTQSTIRENTQITQTELRRLQIKQEVASAQLQLSSIQSEIRALQRQKKNSQIKRQLKDLQYQEGMQHSRLRALQYDLDRMSGAPSSPPRPETARAVRKPSPPRRWSATFWLCLLFGWLGAHRFFTGYTSIGLVQLLTFGGFYIWWIIDLISIASGNFQDAQGRPLEKRDPKMAAGCMAGLMVWFGAAMACTLTGMMLEQNFPAFSTAPSTGNASPAGGIFALIYSFLPLVLGLLAFLYWRDRPAARAAIQRIVNPQKASPKTDADSSQASQPPVTGEQP